MENKLINDALKVLSKEVIGEQTNLKIMLFMLASKKLINKHPGSFNILVNSSSGAGKDHLLKSVMQCLENSEVEMYSRISSRALDYLHAGDKEFTWDNKFLILNDIEQEILNGTTMKVFITEGVNTVIVDQGVSKVNKVKGIPTLFITTAYSNPNEELLRRFNIINIDESEEQTKLIMKLKSDTPVDFKPIRDKFNQLKSYEVVVPYWDKLVDLLPCQDVFLRSFAIKIKDFIKASAVVNQNNRDIVKGKIIANQKDYENCKFIIDNLIKGKNFKPVSNRIKYHLDTICKCFGNNEFIVKEFIDEVGYSKSQAYRVLNNLVNRGYLETEFKASDYYKFKQTNTYKLAEIKEQKMPSVKSVFGEIKTEKDTPQVAHNTASDSVLTPVKTDLCTGHHWTPLDNAKSKHLNTKRT